MELVSEDNVVYWLQALTGKLTNARHCAANFRFNLDMRRNLIASRGTLIPVTLGDGAPGREWPLRNRAAASFILPLSGNSNRLKLE